ncbi:Zinc finger, CCCH-type [Corchorus olitorius]|uniref:Zinc finger, CCCH-type n=1 Tax=Corchorus olitorius TaxID=93759 RepID=A0A1R3IJG0_9ROSI|nr:Zinc finger, CCCH-type [Corchorus olitorius]
MGEAETILMEEGGEGREAHPMEETDDDWEYVEEGPAEIIWQGNEIIVRKKKVRVPKKDANQRSKEEQPFWMLKDFVPQDANRPTSNPLPPQSEAFSEYLNASSAQQVLESVAKEVPNFGTEQDKAHCPFHLKTGACRFGQRCSRVHFYPDKSCTLLIRNMYNGPGLAWEQDEGLEYTDEEVERCYEEFYEDVHTEFLKFGEIVNFKVCRNGSFHLRGNVYVHYKFLEPAVLAYHSINGRYFAGKQVKCEFVNVTKWKVAICGEFMKSRLKTCSRGTACNFIHCFRNPGGDYEWADWDKPPPRYWVKEMAALFGYSDEAGFEKQIEQENSGPSRDSSRMVKSDAERHRSRRSKSRELNHSVGGADRSPRNNDGIQESSHSQIGKSNGRKQMKRQSTSLKWDQRIHDTSSDGGYLDYERGKNNDREQTKVLDGRSGRHSTSLKWDRRSERVHDTSSDESYSDCRRGKNNDREQAKILDGRSERQITSLKQCRSHKRIHYTSSDEGYSDSQRSKNNDRKQANAIDGRSERQSTSSKRDQNSGRIFDTSSDEGYLDSERFRRNDRKQTKDLGGRSDKRSASFKRDRSSDRVHDTSSDNGYSDSQRVKHNDRWQTKNPGERSDRRRHSSSFKRYRNSDRVHDTSSDDGYSDSQKVKHNERWQTKNSGERSDRRSASFKRDRSSDRVHDTSSDDGYSDSQRVKQNDRWQTKNPDERSDRRRHSSSFKRDRNSERVHDTSSDDGYSDSQRVKHNDRWQTKNSGERSDRRHSSSFKRDRSSERIQDTSLDEDYLYGQSIEHNDRKRTKKLGRRSDMRSSSFKRDQKSEGIHDTSSDEYYLDSRRSKHNDRKRTKVLEGRSDRWNASSNQDQDNERIHDTGSDGGYSERDKDGTRDTDKVRHHSHTKKKRKS